MVNELNDNSLIWKTDSIKLVDIWNSTYGIITNHSDIKIAIENDKVKIDPVSVEEMSCGQ